MTGSVSGTLTVTSLGVTVSLNKASGSPGRHLPTDCHEHRQRDRHLQPAARGPGRNGGQPRASQVTLAPGASQMVPINTGAVDFAVPGTLVHGGGHLDTTRPFWVRPRPT